MNKPQSQEILAFLKANYKLDGDLSLIYGEFDLNYRLSRENGESFLVKIGPSDADLKLVQEQQELMEFLTSGHKELLVPKPIKSVEGKLVTLMSSRPVRILSWLDGKLWSTINPHPEKLREQLGRQAGKLDLALAEYSETPRSYNPKWDLTNALWVKSEMHHFEGKEAELLNHFMARFESQKASFEGLRKQWIHNDLNDNNILVSLIDDKPEINGIIDFGDLAYSQTIGELAVCAAYVMNEFPDPLAAILPLVKGYNSVLALQEQELKLLYDLIGMRLVISATVGCINAIQQPDNEYLQISQKAVWENLNRWASVHPRFAYYSFREACGLKAHPKSESFEQLAKNSRFSFKDVFPTTDFKSAQHLDLSVSSLWIGTQSEFNNLELFEFKIDQLQKENPDKIIAGGYQEPRPLYTDSAYDTVGNYGAQSRTVHLGVDFWLPAETPVHSLHKGEVVIAVNDQGNKEYGGLVVLKHLEDGLEFYTLYGHLIPETALVHKLGDVIEAGGCVGKLGAAHENGNWSPHLHYQFMLDILDYDNDFPGVCYAHQKEVWKDLCPDPNLFFKDEALKSKESQDKEELADKRRSVLGQGMSLSYSEPLHIVRGHGVYLMDNWGRKYIDTVNNVAHVGHEHPKVVKAAQKQMASLNTNTRYLHKNLVEFAEQLLATFPKELSVVHFVNSGSEANELAVRMAEAVSGSRHMLVSESGYHGNTRTCVDLSHYKFARKGGYTPPETTHVFPIPDKFRGNYSGKDAGPKYAEDLGRKIEVLQAQGVNPGGLLLEPILSCGGQIPLPDNYLPAVYNEVRAAGGVCISDEVQVGMGRLGDTFWGFEQYGVVPEIVTIGKPIGNGHPLGAVVCTREVAEAFNNGMEYFNTFGGNPVSAAVGKAVLEVISEEGLRQNATEVGNYLIAGLKDLSKQHPIIADIRGKGFFLGFELCDSHLKPLTAQAKYLADRMKYYGFLMSVDGPDNNVIKIKPPMVFSRDNAAELLHYLDKVFMEDKMKNYEA